MRAIEINDLKQGMKIARSIYDDNGRVLLSSGTILTKRYIEKLGMFGIPFIYVEDELVGPMEVQDIIHERVRIQTIKALKNVVECARTRTEIDIKPVGDMVNKILDDLKDVPNMLMQLMDIRSSNMYIYNHSVAVCVLSIMTGMSLGLDELKLKTLGMGAILHDVGRSLSPGPEHTLHGFEILRNNKLMSIMVAHVAYQHHEKYDGTGYPRSLQGENIHLYAAITAVSNHYDTLVSNPEMDKRLYPYQALEIVMAESSRSFHPELVRAFCSNIAPYPVGSTVRLNNGALGIVVAVPKHYSTRPVIRLITNNKGSKLHQFTDIDLMKERTLFVNEVISEQERESIISL